MIVMFLSGFGLTSMFRAASWRELTPGLEVCVGELHLDLLPAEVRQVEVRPAQQTGRDQGTVGQGGVRPSCVRHLQYNTFNTAPGGVD